MKKLGLAVFLGLVTAIGLQAQDTDQGTLSVDEDPRINRVMAIKKQVNDQAENVYRIQVFYGNRSEAERVKADFSEEFPNWKAVLNFDSPYYKVQVGRYTTRLEADRRLAEVKKKFPSAFLLAPQKG